MAIKLAKLLPKFSKRSRVIDEFHLLKKIYKISCPSLYSLILTSSMVYPCMNLFMHLFINPSIYRVHPSIHPSKHFSIILIDCSRLQATWCFISHRLLWHCIQLYTQLYIITSLSQATLTFHTPPSLPWSTITRLDLCIFNQSESFNCQLNYNLLCLWFDQLTNQRSSA